MRPDLLRIHSKGRNKALAFFFVFTLVLSTAAAANTQLVLSRGNQSAHNGEFSGIIDLVIVPGFEHAHVTVTVDGQSVASGIQSPHRITVDLGPTAIEHKIVITATGDNGRRVQWTETINKGMQPLGLQVKAIDLTAGIFEVRATSPQHDPIDVVELWADGEVIASVSKPPYRFTVPGIILESGFVQFTARTKSGEEVADFWSPSGNIHAEQMQVRTVPIFVSVVDRNGTTQADVDRSLFRILDKEAEARIIEFGKAFDQPISIALLLDASASMTHSMRHATKAASDFVRHALKKGDRASVTAIQDVPRRRQALTDDHEAISKALENIEPAGRTALYDGVATAIRELREETNRRAIVVLTDGGDTSSMWSYKEVEKLAGQAGIPVYFILYEGGSDGDALRILDRLRYLAAQTGGFVATATQQNLAAKYGEIERDLRAQFAIRYEVADFGRSNEWRPVRVVIASPKLTARTIKGYFTP
jgi:Ca-activated chloride channel homolog